MIYRFTGIPEGNVVQFITESNNSSTLVGQCSKGQVLVDTNSDYKNCEITEISGHLIEVSDNRFGGFMFIPEQDTEEFIRTREYDFEMLGKKDLEYVDVDDLPEHYGNTPEEKMKKHLEYLEKALEIINKNQ